MEVVVKSHWTMTFWKGSGIFCPAGKVRRLTKQSSMESFSKSGSGFCYCKTSFKSLCEFPKICICLRTCVTKLWQVNIRVVFQHWTGTCQQAAPCDQCSYSLIHIFPSMSVTFLHIIQIIPVTMKVFGGFSHGVRYMYMQTDTAVLNFSPCTQTQF